VITPTLTMWSLPVSPGQVDGHHQARRLRPRGPSNPGRRAKKHTLRDGSRRRSSIGRCTVALAVSRAHTVRHAGRAAGRVSASRARSGGAAGPNLHGRRCRERRQQGSPTDCPSNSPPLSLSSIGHRAPACRPVRRRGAPFGRHRGAAAAS